MSKFIWVRDRDRCEHFINVDYIVRVTKVPGNTTLRSPAYGYLVVADGTTGGNKEISLGADSPDTYEDVIEKVAGA